MKKTSKKPIYVIGLEYYFPQLKESGGYIYDSYFTDKKEADKECEVARKKIQAWETRRGKQLPSFIPIEAILNKIYVKELKLKEKQNEKENGNNLKIKSVPKT